VTCLRRDATARRTSGQPDFEARPRQRQAAADRAAATLAVWASANLSLPNAPFILAPDMPSGDDAMTLAAATAAPSAVTVPPIQPLTPTKTWFDAVDAIPFHQGLLSALRDYAP
jgi:5-methylthioadenosine/S-adenosylhomocysteine deaminase